MSTPAARLLFPDPVVEPGADRIDTSPPDLADPPSLVHSAEMFPVAPFVFQSLEPASFSVMDTWWHMSGELPFKAPVSDLVAGGAWKIDRAFANPEPMIKLDLDDGGAPSAVEFKDANVLNLWIEPFDDPLLTIVSAFKANGLAAHLDAPTVVLGPALAALQEIVDVLAKFVGLPELHVEVTAGNGPVPSHVVRFNLRLRIPNALHTRIDIGVGKFHGGMQLMGELHADVTGATRGRLDIELAGDVQQGIIPPLLYVGGYFRFALGITDGGTPRVEMGLATTASIGGDLVKNLIEIELPSGTDTRWCPRHSNPACFSAWRCAPSCWQGFSGCRSAPTSWLASTPRSREEDGDDLGRDRSRRPCSSPGASRRSARSAPNRTRTSAHRTRGRRGPSLLVPGRRRTVVTWRT